MYVGGLGSQNPAFSKWRTGDRGSCPCSFMSSPTPMPAIVVFIAPSKLEVYSVQGVKGSNLQPKLNMLKT